MIENNIRLIYTILYKVSQDRSFVEPAFRSWYRDKSNDVLKIDDLLTYFTEEVGLNQNEKRTFRISFYSLQQQSSDNLLQVPRILLMESNTSVQKQENESIHKTDPYSHLTDQEFIFGLFLDNLIDAAKAQDVDCVDDIIEYFLDKKVIKSMKLTPLALEQLKVWLSLQLNQRFNASSVNGKNMHSIFHHVYIALCEILGPVSADKVLNEALSKTSQNNRSNKYHPSQFL